MTVSILSRLTIDDRAKHQVYADQSDEIFAKFDGRLLSVDGASLVLAGNWQVIRSLFLELSSKKSAFRWMQSQEYQRISQQRNAGSTMSSILV